MLTSAIIVRLRVYANYADFFDLQYDLQRKLKSVLEDHNVSIPYPHRVVHHVGQASIQNPSDKA